MSLSLIQAFTLDPNKKVSETFSLFSEGMDKILDTFDVSKVEDADMVLKYSVAYVIHIFNV